MSLQTIFPFTEPTNYTFDSAKIKVDGKASLILADLINQHFIQDYSNDIGFTYNSALAEFLAVKVQQKDQRQSDATFGASYNLGINGNWGDGILTGTQVGGATINGGKLDLAYNDLRYVDYSALANADSQQTISIKFKYTPNYNGANSTEQSIFCISKAPNDAKNMIYFRHRLGTATGQYLVLHIYDQNGVLIQEQVLEFWIAVKNQEYEFEIDFNITTGNLYFFIDGDMKWSGSIGTGTRDSNIGLLRIGSNYKQQYTSNFKIDDFVIFTTIQHTANYTPGYTISDYLYVENKVDLPQFSYSGLGALQAFAAFTETGSGSPHYILNGKYWDGVAWSVSDGSYSQASSAANVNTNIGSLMAADTLDISIIFPNSNTLSYVGNTDVNYIGQLIPTDNPTIEINTSIYADKIDDAVEDSTILGSDNIKWVVKVGTDWYYISGGVPTITDGATYAESNTIAEWSAIWPTWDPIGAAQIKFKAFLHSDDGSTTPELDTLTVDYDFQGTQEDEINKSIIYGYQKNPDGSPDETSFTVSLTQNIVMYKTNISIVKESYTVTPDSYGYWEIELAETDNMESTPKYQWNFTNTTYQSNVENIETQSFWDLLNLKRIGSNC